MQTAKYCPQRSYVPPVTRAADYETPEGDGVTSGGYRLRNVINLSCWKTDLRKPARDIDLFRRVCPVIHGACDSNDNAVLR